MAGGCAISYVDTNDTRRIVGLADVEVKPAGGSDTFTGDLVTIRVFGLGFNSSGGSANYTLGYVRESVAFLKNCEVNAFPDCRRESVAPTAERQGALVQHPKVPGGVSGGFGFVDIRLPAPDADRVAGLAVDVTTIGLAWVETAASGRLHLGYNNAAVASLKDGALVIGHPLRIAVPTAVAEKGETDDDTPS